jgi:hypothetical protein
MNDALQAAYEAAAPRTTATFEQFCAAVVGWDAVPVTVGDALAGAVLIKGPELHACILPAFFGRWLTRAVLRQTLHQVLARHGYALTRTTSGNAIGHAFVARLGFHKISDVDGVATYKLEANHGN